jgi:hypothetical protein
VVLAGRLSLAAQPFAYYFVITLGIKTRLGRKRGKAWLSGFRLRQFLDSGFRRNDDKEMAAGLAPERLNPGPE